MPQTPTILIIIVTWNKKQYVVDLLDSVMTLDYLTEAIDILVVDNASNDGTAELLETSYPYVHLIRNEENLGGTGGFNTGLEWAFSQPEDRYKYLWLLDNDVLVHLAGIGGGIGECVGRKV
ncbi:MAG: glycosyltransferase [Thiotrichaceae bacterium]